MVVALNTYSMVSALRFRPELLDELEVAPVDR